MKFYCFRQSNPRGVMLKDMPYLLYVEAPNAQTANHIAEENGVYFDGVSLGIDCDCCNDRWYRVEEWEGNEEHPKIGEDVKIIYASALMKELV